MPAATIARLALLLGAVKVARFAMPRFHPNGAIPRAIAACAGSDDKGRIAWHADGCFPGLDPTLAGAFATLGVRGARRGHAVLGAY
jgi:hypothetical protein